MPAVTVDVWKIEKTGYPTADEVAADTSADDGNRFFVGNGNIGIRGTLDEYRRDKQPAINLAGIFDRNPESLWREPINAPNALFVKLGDVGAAVSHRQSLDVRHGIFARETEFERGFLAAERFASMDKHRLICQRLRFSGDIAPEIDMDIWDLNGVHLFDIDVTVDGDLTRIRAVTGEKRIPVSVNVVVKRHGEFYDRMITINGEPFFGDYDEERAKHCAAWEKLWSHSAVTITGDENAQLWINYSIYHLHSIAPRHSDALSIPARGLSGQTYKGAVFWDTEIFLLPFFARTEPELARKLIMYRIKTLGGALEKAKSYGYRGAFYAWESQEGGVDACTDFNVIDVFTNRPVRTYFRDKQIHISGDIVYAMKNYIAVTGDDSILAEGGAEVIKQCAEFYKSRAVCRVGSDELEFRDVIGPDEYHERVDNNAFTNKIAEFTLKSAGFDGVKVRAPRVKNGVIEQFDGYFDLEDATIEQVKSRLKHPREYWGTPAGVAFTTKVVKQADVIAMLQLFGDEFSDEILAKNWEYYEPRTEHGSSLSACMYALTACRIGRTDIAYKFFEKSAAADLRGGGKSWAGDVYIGGTHPAAAGGAWQIAVLGFLGLGNGGEVKPRLPQGIERIECLAVQNGEVVGFAS